MTGEPVLVLGATGRHGNTGAHLVSRLRQEGRAVRALVRATGPRTDALAKLGAEIVVGDLHDRRTLVTALTDVMSAYFTYPVAAGIVDAAANYAAAVRDTGSAARTVVMSMGPAHPQSPSGLGRSQWLAEQVLQWAGVEVVILRVAALFHENLKLLHARSIATGPSGTPSARSRLRGSVDRTRLNSRWRRCWTHDASPARWSMCPAPNNSATRRSPRS